ncbi:MAG: tRNA (adenosine(37)-N6)-dimethylallyltransferase MiaA, partial [Candidatus Brocadiae bacterium]|nr:tRNA (adenosine(37)-N6)-dimethylallyltransferase MiaA [Candidatus Brocadiia bacterium]
MGAGRGPGTAAEGDDPGRRRLGEGERGRPPRPRLPAGERTLAHRGGILGVPLRLGERLGPGNAALDDPHQRVGVVRQRPRRTPRARLGGLPLLARRRRAETRLEGQDDAVRIPHLGGLPPALRGGKSGGPPRGRRVREERFPGRLRLEQDRQRPPVPPDDGPRGRAPLLLPRRPDGPPEVLVRRGDGHLVRGVRIRREGLEVRDRQRVPPPVRPRRDEGRPAHPAQGHLRRSGARPDQLRPVESPPLLRGVLVPELLPDHDLRQGLARRLGRLPGVGRQRARRTLPLLFFRSEGARGRLGPVRDRAVTPALILTGPTASGKSELALAVAERLGAEILAMDSGTVYRGMEIGTAKPTAADRARVPHHLLDLVEASKGFSVADWLAAAGAAESEILARGRRPLFAGGTPLYLQALLRGLFHAPAQDPELRNRFEQLPDLHASLALVDPATAARLHPNDRKRLVRALEVHALTGRPMSAQLGQWAEAGRPARIVWLDPPRDV